MRALGAVPRDDGRVEFRVWAPSDASLEVRVSDRRHPLESEDGGTWAATLPAGRGEDYVFVVEGAERPDPCSRFQPRGLLGPSRIVDAASFEIAPFAGVPLEEL